MENLTDEQLIQGINISRLFFQDPSIPPPANRPVDIIGVIDIPTILDNCPVWRAILRAACSEYEYGFVTRPWFSDAQQRLQDAKQEIYAAGLKMRETKGPFHEPEFGADFFTMISDLH